MTASPEAERRRRAELFASMAQPPDDGSYLVSESACTISMDLEISFVHGAWLSVIALAAAAVEAHLRHAEGYGGRTLKDLIACDPELPDDVDWLRRRRNQVMHAEELSVDWIAATEAHREREASRALRALFATFYMNPGV